MGTRASKIAKQNQTGKHDCGDFISGKNSTADGTFHGCAGLSNSSMNPFWNDDKNELDVELYLSGMWTDNATDTTMVTMAANLKRLVQVLLDAGVKSVGLVWQPPPGSQDGFGQDYAVSIVPAGLNLDTAHSMSLQTMPANSRSDPTQPRQMVARVINGVHPGTAGQGQIADAFFGPGLNSSWEITTLFCFNDAFERKMDLLSTNFL
eukprot:gene14841-32680_t